MRHKLSFESNLVTPVTKDEAVVIDCGMTANVQVCRRNHNNSIYRLDCRHDADLSAETVEEFKKEETRSAVLCTDSVPEYDSNFVHSNWNSKLHSNHHAHSSFLSDLQRLWTDEKTEAHIRTHEHGTRSSITQS